MPAGHVRQQVEQRPLPQEDLTGTLRRPGAGNLKDRKPVLSERFKQGSLVCLQIPFSSGLLRVSKML